MNEFRRWLITRPSVPSIINSELMLQAFKDAYVGEGGKERSSDFKNAVDHLRRYGFRPFTKVFNLEDLEMIFTLGEIAATDPGKFYSEARRIF